MAGLLGTNRLAGLLGAPASVNARATLLGAIPKKRKVFFSFHYGDIMRVCNVRNAWKIDHPDSPFARSFYDSGLWESKKLQDPIAIKTLIRQGVQFTSTVCVLVGAETWSRRWVKYEIARSIIDGRGLLAVHINNLNHHQRRVPDVLGINPLHLIGIYKSPSGQYFIYEKQVFANHLTNQYEWRWHPYVDYKLPVSLPRYLPEPGIGYVRPLSEGALQYDFVAGLGHKNIGAWIDTAAQMVGR